MMGVFPGAGTSRGPLCVYGKVGSLDVGDLLYADPSVKWASQY